MRLFFLCIFLIGTSLGLGAQQVHFVYLQTDSHRPFYVLLNQKSYSSSSIGYLILPRLENGAYQLKVGFPKTEEKEQVFTFRIKDNDQGWLIKDFGDKGLGLFNLQTLNIQYAGEAAAAREKELALEEAAKEQQRQAAAALQQAAEKRSQDSLQALAGTPATQPASNDAQPGTTTADPKPATLPDAAAAKKTADSLNAVQAAAREQEPTIPVTPVPAREEGNKPEKNTGNTAVPDRTATNPVAADSSQLPDARSTVAAVPAPQLLQRKFTDSGWVYTYTISDSGKKENVNVFIPVRRAQAGPATKVPVKEKTATQQDSHSTTPAGTDAPANNGFLNMDFGADTPSTISVHTDSTMPGVKILHNSNCRAMADEKFFLNTRKKMTAASSTENMIAAARKLMKEKCFTTDQIRNLSYLFLTDADRYQFLDAAYPFAMDAYRYQSLQDLLKDDYFVQRFKAMLH